jgi:MarR family transcriptional regulator, organic hydroperoxide resistance regulator
MSRNFSSLRPKMEKSKLIADTIDNLRRVFQAIQEYSKKVEHTTGLTSPQLWAIKVLTEGAPMMVSELARLMYLHPATVVGVLTRLESHDLIKKTRSKEDRRIVWVELTSKGKELVAAAPEVAQGLLVVGLEKTPLSGLEEINKGLKKLVSILGAEGTLPHLILSQEVSLPLKRKKGTKPTKVKPSRQGKHK